MFSQRISSLPLITITDKPSPHPLHPKNSPATLMTSLNLTHNNNID